MFTSLFFLVVIMEREGMVPADMDYAKIQAVSGICHIYRGNDERNKM